MADFNPVNYVGFQDPAAAIKIQQQQALAAQLMAEGEPRKDINALTGSGPYAQVAPYSPLEGFSKALEKGLGGYMQGKSNAALAKALQNPSQGGTAGASDPMMPTMQERLLDGMSPGMGKAAYETRVSGIKKGLESQNTPMVTPQGTYQMGGGVTPPSAAAPAPQQPSSAPPAPQMVNGQPQAPANMDELLNAQSSSPQDVAKPVILSGASDEQPQLPLASDGKPLLPDIKNIPTPDPTGTPKLKTENTKTGVEQTILDQKDSAEGNKAFAATAQSLGQEKARLDNLIQVYKDIQSGTLTAQNPEVFNKLAALGFKDDPASIKDLAGIQNATQNHILQVIQQIKDTNANAGGGAPTRVFGSEISQLLENGESTKGQPEALWNVIGQAKGVVDHHLDMVNGWQKSGGLGNRLAGGYTMRPDDFATQFSTHHNITDYRDKALKDMGPFKGMAGNNGGNRISIVDPQGNAGTIDKAHLQSLLDAGGKLAQ